MSTQAQKLGTILIVDDEVVTFYGYIARELAGTYEVVTCTSKQEVVSHPEVFNPQLALVDLNLDRKHDGFEVVDYLNKVYPKLPVIVVTKEDVGTTVLDAQEKENVKKVLIKSHYDAAEWIKVIDETILEFSKTPLTTIYLAYHPKDTAMAKVIMSALNNTAKCKVIDGAAITPVNSTANLMLVLISKNVIDDSQNRVLNAINWGVDVKKTIKGTWIDSVSRNRGKNKEKTPQPCSGSNMVADFSECLKQLDTKKVSLLGTLLEKDKDFKEFDPMVDVFKVEVEKILKAFKLG